MVPIEVKAEENLKSKSLKQFHENNSDSRPIRISMSEYGTRGDITNFPLYTALRIPDIIESD